MGRVAPRERVEGPHAQERARRPGGVGAVHALELGVKGREAVLLGRRREPGHALRWDQTGEDAVALRPGRGEQQLALRQPVRTQICPDRPLVDRDELRCLRLALRSQRGETFGRDPVDPNPVEDAYRQRADDGLRAHVLAGLERHSATRPRDGDGGRDCTEPNPLAELRPHAQCDLGRPLRDLEALPQVVRVEALVADGSRLAQLREQRRPLARAGRERECSGLDSTHRRG